MGRSGMCSKGGARFGRAGRALRGMLPVLALSLAACSARESDGARAAPAAPAAATAAPSPTGAPTALAGVSQPLTTLRLGNVGFNWGEQLPLIVAGDQGWLREVGLAVEIVSIS